MQPIRRMSEEDRRLSLPNSERQAQTGNGWKGGADTNI